MAEPVDMTTETAFRERIAEHDRQYEARFMALEKQHALVASALELRFSEREKWAEERDQRYAEHFRMLEEAIRLSFMEVEKTTERAMLNIKENTAAALAAAKEAVTKAEVASEKRFDSVNEFRNTLRDQQASLATKTDVDSRISALTKEVDQLRTYQDELRGAGGVRKETKDDRLSILAIVVSIGAIATSVIIALVFHA